MMTTTLRAALIFVSLGTCCLIMRKIRQSKMQIESAIFWIVLSLVLLCFKKTRKAGFWALVCFPRWQIFALAFWEFMQPQTFCFCLRFLF